MDDALLAAGLKKPGTIYVVRSETDRAKRLGRYVPAEWCPLPVLPIVARIILYAWSTLYGVRRMTAQC